MLFVDNRMTVGGRSRRFAVGTRYMVVAGVRPKNIDRSGWYIVGKRGITDVGMVC